MAQINIIDYNKIVYFDENTGNYKIFDGERWWLSDDKFGTSTKPSDVALVDSAIVDKSVVGEEEAPAMQTIWEGTFTGEEQTQGGVTYYFVQYDSTNMQRLAELLNIDEVTVTFDDVSYTCQVEVSENSCTFGADGPLFNDYPFMLSAVYRTTPTIVDFYNVFIAAQTAGPHTLKVEYTPVEPSSEILYENTFVPQSELDAETGDYRYWYDTTVVQNLWEIADKENVKVTLDGTSYILNVDKEEEHETWSLGDSAFVGCPFFLTISEITDTDTETSETSYEMTIEIETGGEHTIKIETTNEEVPIVVPGGGEVDWSALQPGKDN